MKHVRAAAIVLAALAVVGALAVRVVVEGRGALADGDDARQRGRTAEAIRDYETAARWYLPLARHVDDAYDSLRALAGSTTPAVSLAAWRAIRSAARATRSLWTPHADDLAAADAAIARLSATAPGAATTDPAWHRERLARDPRARTGCVALAAFGLIAWIAGAWLLVRRGSTPAGARTRLTLPGAAAIVLGMACWLVGLYNA